MSEETKASFLRQSGWMAIATAIGGAASFTAHIFAKDMPKEEYGGFTAMLQLLNLIAIPAIGLQAVFAVKSAQRKTEADDFRMAREQWAITVVVLALAVLVFIVARLNGESLVNALSLPSWWVLALTLGAGVFALLMPMMFGVLQGRENFLWLGWALLSLGVLRLAAMAGLIRMHDETAINGMIAVAAGYVLAFGMALSTAKLPRLEPAEWLPSVTRIDWRDLAKRFLPLSIGGGTVIFMMSVDMVVVQRFFDESQTGYYAAAGMIGRALIFFVGPMVAVMFPKIVKSHAEQKPTDVLRFTLLLTAGLCAVAIILGVTVPDLPLRMVYDESFLKATPLVPWFIAAMAPLALTAVLVNNILARCKSNNVYLLLGVPVIYGGMLWFVGPQIADQTASEFNVHAHISMVQLIGMGNLCFLASTVILTWVVNQEEKHRRAQTPPDENPSPDEAEAH